MNEKEALLKTTTGLRLEESLGFKAIENSIMFTDLEGYYYNCSSIGSKLI